MIKNVLLDLDDTLLDFHRAEAEAIRHTLREFGIDPTDETIRLYSKINRSCWEKLERGEKIIVSSRSLGYKIDRRYL